MPRIVFFNPDQKQEEDIIVKNDDIRNIFSKPKPGALVILDIDDTIGRVSQTIGLDPWFRFRIAQYTNEGHTASQALSKAITLYNLAQLASKAMVPVEKNIKIGALIEELKSSGVSVIALTARNFELSDQTLKLLGTLNVALSQNIIKNAQFFLDNKKVEIKNGIIFANGNHKGLCIEQAITEGHFVVPFHLYKEVHCVDDSEKNCHALKESLSKLKVQQISIWHHTYAETNFPWNPIDQKRAAVQEEHLLKNNILLSDAEADGFVMKQI